MFYRFKKEQVHIDVVFAEKQSGVNILKLPGLPSFPREDNFTEFCCRTGFNVFIPHYLGSWLSDGVFTPKNCLKTIEIARDFIEKGKGTELYNYGIKKWPVEKIVLVGSSFGGYMALKYCSFSDIEKCVLFSPLIDLKKQGRVNNEEKMSHTLRFVREVFKNGFRGIEKKEWEKFFSGKLKEMSINFSGLKKTSFFVCHGDEDPTIDVSHTGEFIKNLSREKVHFFKIPKANHKVWDYLTPEILEEFKSWTWE